jgi:hypothetical protein
LNFRDQLKSSPGSSAPWVMSILFSLYTTTDILLRLTMSGAAPQGTEDLFCTWETDDFQVRTCTKCPPLSQYYAFMWPCCSTRDNAQSTGRKPTVGTVEPMRGGICRVPRGAYAASTTDAGLAPHRSGPDDRCVELAPFRQWVRHTPG